MIELIFNIAYSIIVIILGITGNSLVVYTSLHYPSQTEDAITIVFIRHLAIADVCFVIGRALPATLVLFTNSWVFGPVLCHITAYCACVFPIANLNFIFFVSLHRLLRCTLPWEALKLTKLRAACMAGMIWAYSMVDLIIIAVFQINAEYRADILRCITNYTPFSNSYPTMWIIMWTWTKGLPFFGSLIINLILLLYARNKTHSMNLQAIKTVCSISGLLILSWSPSILYSVFLLCDGLSHVIVEKVSYNFYLISVFGNPIVYCFCNKNFLNFVDKTVERLCNKVITRYTGPEEQHPKAPRPSTPSNR